MNHKKNFLIKSFDILILTYEDKTCLVENIILAKAAVLPIPK